MIDERAPFVILDRGTPIITTALHAGHDVRDSIAASLALSGGDRLREEDPFTELIADIGASSIVVSRSRFEVDLNRPRESAVYLEPSDAWGLDIWREPLPPSLAEESRRIHDEFYRAARELLDSVVERHGAFVLLDVHSYNHRRAGADAPAADTETDPEVNLGTASVDTTRFGPLVESFVATFTRAGYDCRENVKFKGGNFARWVNATYPRQGCALAIEFKKTFMDEWTGVADDALVARANAALREAASELEHLVSESVD